MVSDITRKMKWSKNSLPLAVSRNSNGKRIKLLNCYSYDKIN
jgi:hypothetical protein